MGEGSIRYRLLLRSILGLVGTILALSASLSPSYAFLLVTPDEAIRERSKGKQPKFRGESRIIFGAPGIVLVTPQSTRNIPSPLNIELRFVPTPPSKIVQNSLRVFYGFFGLDVTDRLTKHAVLTASGIVAKNAELPSGSHSITIEISDDQGRVSRKSFDFRIKD